MSRIPVAGATGTNGRELLRQLEKQRSPASLDYHEVAGIIDLVADKTVNHAPVSEDDVRQSLLAGGMPAWNADALGEIQRLFATGRYARVERDLGEVLGRPPRSFQQFATDFAGTSGA